MFIVSCVGLSFNLIQLFILESSWFDGANEALERK
jgi:hypothetical protein